MKHFYAPFPFALVPIAVLTALAAPATAQLTPGNSRTINAPILGLPYTQTGCGDFDGDANADIAYLCGNNLGVMIAPAIFEVTMNNIAVANDFAVVTTHATARILTVSNAVGLREWHMDPAPSSIDPDPPTWVWTAEPVVSPLCTGATILRAWSNDTTSTYVVALNAAGDGLIAMQRTETGGPTTWNTSWTTETSMALTVNAAAGAVVEIVPFNFNGTGAPEVAVLRQNLFEIYRPFDAVQPAPISTVQGLNGYDTTAATLVHHTAQQHEWVAWVLTQKLDGVTQKFMTYGYDGWKNIVTIGNSLQVFAIRAGRVDADGDDDLIVGHRSELGVIYIPNTGAVADAPRFTISNYVNIGAIPGEAAPTNQARPYIADLDGDGDGDFGFPVRDEDEMWIYHDSTNLTITSQPFLDSYLTPNYTDVAVQLVGTDTLNRIHFMIDVPAVPTSAPAGPRYLEVKLYSMRYDPNATANYVESAPFSTERVVIIGSVFDQVTLDRDVPGDQSSAGPGFQRIVYISAQCLVAANATSSPTWAGPCMMVIVQGEDDLQDFGDAHNTNVNRDYVNLHALTDLGVSFELGDASSDAFGVVSLGGSVGNGGYVPCIPVRPGRPPPSQ